MIAKAFMVIATMPCGTADYLQGNCCCYRPLIIITLVLGVFM